MLPSSLITTFNIYWLNLKTMDGTLAKQLWRVLENPSSLVARIYKARYFPHHSFWDAPESIAPSYSWRSIIASKELVLKGMRWQVGAGSSIHTWSDPWIPRAPSFIPYRRGLNVELDSRVKDFITPFNWDIQYLNRVFTPEDVEAILSISLSDRPAVDRCIWHYDPKVQFWKEVWHANIPASAKVCIWKACQAILPTKDRLLHRHVNIADLSCTLCSDALETTTHLCFECPFTKALIEEADPLIHQVCLSPNVQFPSFKGWLQGCFASLSKPSFHKLLFLVWAVWKERNNRTWREKSSTVGDVCFQANAWLHDFQFHQVKKGTAQVSRIATWKPPSAGWLKVNFDGAFSKQTHMGGVVVIIRDSEGSCMGGMFQHIENVYSPEQIEAVAGRIAVRMVQSKNLAPISFETDSLNLACFVNQSSGSITSTYGRL
ncbi:putative reverse transcriptase zinc-binding domain-containing protein [Rosa chinensis]|uniref:Putative reverse transcriptase zinc-binding domain-containing protein n=1 Tax=Rosa chinensis TaxID=74649 RepID=A0A2P6SF00_ROSCH|nr:putative reverse transcriptase zinc-binding domain-containing protein [Rosa chinensis]